MFCPGCGKEVGETDAFCRSCGHRLSADGACTTLRVSKPSGLRFLAGMLLLFGLAFLIPTIYSDSCTPEEKQRKADRAIDAAAEACSQGGRAEFDRRMVEAKLTIGDLDFTDRSIYEAKLNNRLIMMGCK